MVEQKFSAAVAMDDLDSVDALPSLAIGQYRVRLRAVEEVRLPPYAGSAWRGALGHALKQVFCVTRLASCEQCLLYRSCGYAYVFETPPPCNSRKMRKYTAAPHPFVLMPGLDGGLLSPGAEYLLGLSLFGRSNHYLPYFIHALALAANKGIGGRRGRLVLCAVEQLDFQAGGVWRGIYEGAGDCCPLPPEPPSVPGIPPRVKVVLETPLRIKQQGRVVDAQALSFSTFFSNLLRRISLLSHFHGDQSLETDFRGLVSAAAAIGWDEADLHWFDWKRYSSRQQQEMRLGGLLGSFVLEGATLAPFWPYLWLGQYVHTGAVTTMGLGRYRLVSETAALDMEPAARYGPCDVTDGTGRTSA
ncbi:MAG: CRISPR system precrRNA processing endoribonuclease RAMP protein Cas6 [Gammaproteobacteria bacterium]